MLTPPIHLAARHGNETLVRSLILAGARVDDRDAQKRTALHIAAEAGNGSAVSALLQNNADQDAVDVENDNALHIAVREGHLNVIRILLTESTIDAEAFNLKGRNPLHELSKYGKENAAAICELFLECMANYPINTSDIMGNSPLLLAYMKGNANLCRVLVKANACLSTENCERITIFNYQSSAIEKDPHVVTIHLNDDPLNWMCTCPSKAGLRSRCKHIFRVLLYINRDDFDKSPVQT
ncbi:unnamed protein product [Phaedon cochleariae]|uniref:SWIM-type domain-containing protein n=1 Tax=Phaedon cochleariae TaxID=80249 RepID=A0A9N9SF84_PHACE|nr:unnamed protein product [Phaedon cochleariae]